MVKITDELNLNKLNLTKLHYFRELNKKLETLVEQCGQHGIKINEIENVIFDKDDELIPKYHAVSVALSEYYEALNDLKNPPYLIGKDEFLAQDYDS